MSHVGIIQDVFVFYICHDLQLSQGINVLISKLNKYKL